MSRLKAPPRSGWGTISGATLRVLFPSARQLPSASTVVSSIEKHHTVRQRRCSSSWAKSFLGLAAAARTYRPNLIHSLGLVPGAGLVAAGLGVPWIFHAVGIDFSNARLGSSVRRNLKRAHAVIVPSESDANLLRAAGIRRDIYVIETPKSPEDGLFFYSALEIVYGRIMDGRPKGELVQIGSKAQGAPAVLNHQP